MPSISTSVKSIERSSDCSYTCGVATPSAFSPISPSDSSIATAITPMVVGSRTKRAFTYASKAVMTRQMTAIWNMGRFGGWRRSCSLV